MFTFKDDDDDIKTRKQCQPLFRKVNFRHTNTLTANADII